MNETAGLSETIYPVSLLATQEKQPLHAHMIATDEEGNLVGHVAQLSLHDEVSVNLSGLKIYLVRNSQVVSQAVSDQMGQFTLQDVPPGSYALCAVGRNGFLAYGVNIVDHSEAKRLASQQDVAVSFNLTLQEEAPFQIDAAVVPPAFRSLRRIMSRYLPDLADELAGSAAEDDDYELNVDNRSVASDLRVALNPDGSLVGRMSPLTRRRDKPARLREMNAFLIQDDEIYARVPVDEDGIFRFVDVEPGVYSFAAAGEEGFAAISFRAIESAVEEEFETVGYTPVGFGLFRRRWNSACAVPCQPFIATCLPPVANGSLDIALAPPSELPFLQEQLEGADQGGQANGSGGGAGSGGASGGGGGGGAGGGFGGGLAGLGALAGSGLGGGLGGGGFSDPFAQTFPPGGFTDGSPFPGGPGGGFVDGGPTPGGGGTPGGDLGNHPPVPEPATVVIWIGLALGGLAFWWFKKRRTTAAN